MKTNLFLGVLATSIALTLPSKAVPIAYDGFDYSTVDNPGDDTGDIDLFGNNGGSGWSNAWSGAGGLGSNFITSPGFGATAGSLPVSGNKSSLSGNNNGNFRSPSITPDADGATVYISFLGDVDAGEYAGISLFDGGSENLFLGKPFAEANWGIAGAGPNALSSTPASALSLLVYRIDFGALNGGNDTRIRLYVNPAVGTEPLTADATAQRGDFVWDQIRVQSGGGTVTGAFDEIRIGTAYGDVAAVPEPVTAVTLLSGLGVLVGLQRRRASR